LAEVDRSEVGAPAAYPTALVRLADIPQVVLDFAIALRQDCGDHEVQTKLASINDAHTSYSNRHLAFLGSSLSLDTEENGSDTHLWRYRMRFGSSIKNSLKA
jgi:hypothetical protein